MHFRSLRSFTALAIATALVASASAAFAGPKDKDAQKLYDDAINTDYLNAEFGKAEKKLKDAVSKCGDSGCTPELLGKINVALGTVYGVGLSKPDEAKAAFVAALKADPKAALDPSLTTPELTKIFEEAKKAAGGGGKKAPPPSTPGAAGDAQHTPPAESAVDTPLPLYIEPSDEVPLSKVVLRYKPFGATQYQSVEMKKMGKGYGVEVPCKELGTTGDLKYFFAFTGADGEAAGGLGSLKEPFKVAIKSEIEGEAPRLPGKKPPAKCSGEVCPPGMDDPTCGKKGAATDKRGDKGWKASCEATSECKEGLVCLNGTCEEGSEEPGKEHDTGKKKRMNLVSVGVQIDALFIKGADHVCSYGPNAPGGTYACFYQGESRQFVGNAIDYKTSNGITGGFGYADVRIVAGYDRMFSPKVPISAGIRFGVAIGGSPSPSNTDELNKAKINSALGFLPIHAEIRATYHILGSMMEDKKFRPYVFVTPFGFAQVNAAVPVPVCDTNIGPMDTGAKCPTTPASVARTLSAYQITGRNFSGLGVGTTFGITPLFGLSVEAKVMFMWPTFGVVLSPTIGPVFAF